MSLVTNTPLLLLLLSPPLFFVNSVVFSFFCLFVSAFCINDHRLYKSHCPYFIPFFLQPFGRGHFHFLLCFNYEPIFRDVHHIHLKAKIITWFARLRITLFYFQFAFHFLLALVASCVQRPHLQTTSCHTSSRSRRRLHHHTCGLQLVHPFGLLLLTPADEVVNSFKVAPANPEVLLCFVFCVLWCYDV